MTNNYNLKKLIVDSEHIIQSSNIQKKNELRYQISHEIKKLNNKQFNHNNKIHNPISTKEFNNVIKKIQNNNLTVNIDKGDIITIEDKSTLNKKTLTFL